MMIGCNMNKGVYFVYFICLLVGGLCGFFVIDLKPSSSNRPLVEVKVKAAEPRIIRDTITIVKVKYRNIYKRNCCSTMCVNKDTLKLQ